MIFRHKKINSFLSEVIEKSLAIIISQISCLVLLKFLCGIFPLWVLPLKYLELELINKNLMRKEPSEE